MFDLEVRRGNI